MQFPSRKARVALLAGAATLGVAGTASASTADYSTTTNVLTITADAGAGPDCSSASAAVKFNGADPTRDGANGQVTTGCAASVEPRRQRRRRARTTSTCAASRATEWTGLAGANAAPAISLGDGDDTVTRHRVPRHDQPRQRRRQRQGPRRRRHDDLELRARTRDVMNGGDGVDTVDRRGRQRRREFEIKPKAGDPTRVDASRINNPFTLDIDGREAPRSRATAATTRSRAARHRRPDQGHHTGGDGNDALIGTDGDDAMDGGAGNDIARSAPRATTTWPAATATTS